MATTNFQLVIASDISNGSLNDSIALDVNYDVTSDGTLGIENTTGIGRLKPGTSGTTLVTESSFYGTTLTNDTAILYLRNLDTTFGNRVEVRIGDDQQHSVVCSIIYGGQFAVIPLPNTRNSYYNAGDNSATNVSNVKVVADDAGTILEYAVFYTH